MSDSPAVLSECNKVGEGVVCSPVTRRFFLIVGKQRLLGTSAAAPSLTAVGLRGSCYIYNVFYGSLKHKQIQPGSGNL